MSDVPDKQTLRSLSIDVLRQDSKDAFQIYIDGFKEQLEAVRDKLEASDPTDSILTATSQAHISMLKYLIKEVDEPLVLVKKKGKKEVANHSLNIPKK